MNETMPPSESPQINQQLLIPGAIVLAGLLVAGAVVYGGGPSGGVGGTGTEIEIGANATKVIEAVESKSADYEGELATDLEEGRVLGVKSTPSVLIGTELIVGALPYEEFKTAIDAALKGDNGNGEFDINDVSDDSGPFIGNANAPVTIAYWSDYQCPFCKRFEQQSLAKIVRDYVTPGKVRVLLKDFQFLGPDSDIAGVYGRAVWDLYPDKYWEWREAMYDAQDEEHGGFGDEESIQVLTTSILD